MWFSKKESSKETIQEPTSVAVVEATYPSKLLPPRAEPVEPEMDDAERDEYFRVAASVGISDSPAVLEERLCVVLQEENIQEYPPEKVAKYLNQELGKGQWVWAGLRQIDVDHLKGWTDTHGETVVSFGERQYGGEIPLPVLLTIEKIQTKLPEVYFYISEKENSDDDPFLMVTARGIHSYIIERWDEPGFRISDGADKPTE